MAPDAPVDLSQEIEYFLFEKFKGGLDKNKSSSKMLSGRFKELQGLLEGKLESSQGGAADQKSLRDHLYFVNNVLAECQTLSAKPISFHYQYQIRGRLNDVIKKLKEQSNAAADGAATAEDNNEAMPSENQEPSPPISQLPDQVKVKEEALHNELILLETLVREADADRFKAIAVVGAGGIGKTILCQLFFRKEEERKEYLPRIWVSLSRLSVDEEGPKVAIVKRMLVELGVEQEVFNLQSTDTSADQRLRRLVRLLHRHLWGKKYLIVLDGASVADDEWYQKLGSPCGLRDDWGDYLAHGLPKGYGGRVIVTCRNEELAMKMVGTENLHSMMPLSDPGICWSIFQDSAELEYNKPDPPQIEELKEEINKKCAGVPLVAKIIGQIKRNQPPTTSTENVNVTQELKV